MHEHIARAMYYLSIQLLFASIVGLSAWALTSILPASATTKYWIWVATTLNFVLPLGAVIDKLGAPQLTWARPLAVIGGPIWDMTQGHTAVVLGMIWIAGTSSMLLRLISRLRTEQRSVQAQADARDQGITSDFVREGIPVRFGRNHQSPAVRGVLYPRVVLPAGLDRLLNQREFDAVLLHELAHARRRDNLIRLLYEFSLCALWFHPLLWLSGALMARYRELSCDESVIRRSHGQELVSALAKLAVPGQAGILQATASSHLSYRLARLADPRPTTSAAASLLLTSLFAVVLAAGIVQTIAHTACCFLLKH